MQKLKLQIKNQNPPKTLNFNPRRRQSGFTLVELLLVIAIMLALAAAASPLYGNLHLSTQLNENIAQIIQTTRIARERSFSRLNNSSHGVYFEINPAGNDKFILYQGNSYATRDVEYDRTVTLDSPLSLSMNLKYVSAGPLQFESGSLSTDENWKTVVLQNNYINPIIVASYQESNNTLPASVRIRNASSTGFEIRLQNPSGSNLSPDEITYFVIEEGVWNINGVLVEASKYDTNTTGSSAGGWLYDLKTFSQTFAADPIVLHQVMTDNDSSWITSYVSSESGRWNPPGATGMRIALNGAEATTTHGTETIGWIAMTMDTTATLGGIPFETYRTSDSVLGHDDGCYTFNYQNTYANPPIVLGFQEKMDGANGGWSVTCSNSPSQAGFHTEEDQVVDSERSHTSETMAFIAFASPAVYSETLREINFSKGLGIPNATGTVTLTHSVKGKRTMRINDFGMAEEK